jgi:hypothetical protein
MGHACQLSFSPRILTLQEIPTPGPLDTTAAKRPGNGCPILFAYFAKRVGA